MHQLTFLKEKRKKIKKCLFYYEIVLSLPLKNNNNLQSKSNTQQLTCIVCLCMKQMHKYKRIFNQQKKYYL